LTGQHYQGRGRKEKLTKAQQAQLVKLIKEALCEIQWVIKF